MVTFGPDDELEGAQFTGVNLRGARFDRSSLREVRIVNSDVTGLVVRGSGVDNVDIDDPWLAGVQSFKVNGIDVVGFVEAELDRQFPGRSRRRATDPDGLREAWSALQETWAATLAQVAELPEETVDVSVDEEWSFAQTLRHLVMATDTWLGKAVLGREQPYHPLGLANAEAADDGLDLSIFATDHPTYAEVLAARADRTGMVHNFLAIVTAEQLDEPRQNPWAPEYPETVRSCLHTILEEEWEHHRYAVRDLAAIVAGRGGPGTD